VLSGLVTSFALMLLCGVMLFGSGCVGFIPIRMDLARSENVTSHNITITIEKIHNIEMRFEAIRDVTICPENTFFVFGPIKFSRTTTVYCVRFTIRDDFRPLFRMYHGVLPSFRSY
jgi:hypothetical protein